MDGQHRVHVTRRLGDGRFEVLCLGDGATRLAHVRDKLWWRVWVSTYDLVLVALRSFQDGKVDIVAAHVYRRGGALLERSGEVPVGAAGPTDADGDAAHERGLQAVRDVHGHALADFLPTEEEFGFCEDAGEDGVAVGEGRV